MRSAKPDSMSAFNEAHEETQHAGIQRLQLVAPERAKTGLIKLRLMYPQLKALSFVATGSSTDLTQIRNEYWTRPAILFGHVESVGKVTCGA